MSIHQILSGGRFNQALKYRKDNHRRGDGAGGGICQWGFLGCVIGQFPYGYIRRLAGVAASTHKGGER